jgi:PAS domain S-box-containing protein
VTEGRWEHVIRHIQDAVVEFELVDDEPVIRRVNRAFEDTFGYQRDAIEGDRLNDRIVPDWLADEAQELDDRTASGKVNYQRVRRQTAEGLREFLYRGIPYDGADDGVDGFAVYTDLTPINRRERQLKVLNRVLRHNLRNRATVINGHIDRLFDAVEAQSPETSRHADAVAEAARDLELLASEASQIQRVLASDPEDGATVDCTRIVRELVATYREQHPEASIAVATPESLFVGATSQLSIALDNLVENAIEHNPRERPRVLIDARTDREDGWVTLHVDDDGPRIPAEERAVVSGDRPITQTRHGQGLGLWLVRWTVEQFGGELLFAESDIGGNSVRLRLPLPGDGRE